MSAYACAPGEGSEPGVGWEIARAVAGRHDVWVVTRANNRLVIERERIQDTRPGLRFVYFDLPRWCRWWKRGSRGLRLYYYLWQVGVFFVARRLHRRVGFDVAHHVTFVKYWVPSFVSLLPIPFVWGPLGGGESTPAAFWSRLSLRGKAYETLRVIARWIGEHDPFVRLTAKRCAVALAATPETAARLRRLGVEHVRQLSQIGLSDEELDRLGALPAPGGGRVRFVSIGNLLHLKGFHLGLAAFSAAGLDDAEYWIIGSGPERGRLENLSRSLGIHDRVRFLGRLSRQETLRRLAECHVLVHPGLHDSGGWVCLEAMATRRPVLCLALGGPALQVSHRTGIKVPATAPGQATTALAADMRRLAQDPGLRARMGRAGRVRASRHYRWMAKADVIWGEYARAVGR